MDSQQVTNLRPPLGPRILLPLAFVALVVLVYADPLFTGRMFVGRDLVPYGLPMEKATHDAYARGRLPVWNEDVSGGRPLLPNPNAGALYPVRPLLSPLPFPLAMRLFPLIHWAWGGIGMFLLLRALSVSRAAAWIGAATLVFSGVSVSQVFYQPIGPPVAWHPWLLWALVRPAAPRVKAAALGLLWGLMLLLGDAFAVLIAGMAAALWIGLEVPPGERRREASVLVAALVLGALLAAPQIAATLLLASETQRAVMGFPLREVFGFTLSPWRLLELAVPYPFGDSWTLEESRVWGRGVFRCLYATIYCGAFALMALVGTARASARRARFTRALFVAGVVLAVLGSFVPASWGDVRSFVPLRYPEKFSVAIVLALALAAGLSFDRFRNGAPRPAWFLLAGAALGVAAAGARLFPERAAALATSAVGASPALAHEAAEQLPGALAEAGLFWIATLVGLELLRRRGTVRLAVCVALLTAVPIAANRRIAPTEGEGSVLPPTAFARALAKRDPAGAFRTLDEASYRPVTEMLGLARRTSPWGTDWTRRRWDLHAPSLWRRGTVFNADADRGDLARVESLRTLSGLAAAQPMADRFFGSLSLRYGIRFRDQAPLPGFRRFGGDALQDWDENMAAASGLRLLERWREETGALAAARDLPQLGEGAVVLESARDRAGRARPGAVRILDEGPERLILETSAPEATWLFALRGYWSHRTVAVDGRAVDCVPAQLAYSAIPIPAGTHRIDWREEIPGIAVSRWGPALFAAVALLLVLRQPRRERPA